MTQFTYMGSLTDIGLAVITSKSPVMRIRPEVEAFGPAGLVSKSPLPLQVNPNTGVFSVNLYPSGELTPATGGAPGVDYIIDVGRFESALDGTSSFVGWDAWRFTAVAGGGNVGQMQGGSVLAVWVGPPWPTEPLPVGLYIDTEDPNPWGIVT